MRPLRAVPCRNTAISAISRADWAHLELHRLRQDTGSSFTFAPFDMPCGIGRVAGPQSSALPPGLGIVDPAVGRPREEAKRIRHAQRHELLGRPLDDLERVGVDRAVYGRVRAEAEYVVHVHVRQVAFFGMERAAVERRIGLAVERPALGTTLAGALRIARCLTLTAIERGEMSARAPVLPDHALMIGFDAARSEDLDRLIRRRLEKIGLAGRRRVRAALETHQALGAAANARAPQAAVFRIDGDGIAAEIDPVILGRVDRLIRLGPPLGNLAVVVRVQYCRAPTLGGFG